MLEAVLNPQRRWHLLLGLVVYPYLTVMLVYLLATHSLHKLRGQCPACTPPIACTHPSTHDEGART